MEVDRYSFADIAAGPVEKYRWIIASDTKSGMSPSKSLAPAARK